MKSNIKKNYAYNLAYQILTLITPFITTPYVSRVLSAQGVGTYSYIMAVTSYFILFGCMGIATYGQREISYCNSKEDREKVFWEIQFFEIFLLSICLCVYLIFTTFIQNNRILFLIAGLQIISYLFDITWFYYGIEDFKSPVIRNFFIKLLSIILIFVLVKSQQDLSKYMLIMCGSSLLGNTTLWLLLPRYVGKPKLSGLHPFKHFKDAFFLFIPNVAIQIYVNFDKIMIAFITKNAAANGYYEQAQRVENMGLLIVSSLGTVMIPRIGNYYSKNDSEAIKRTLYKNFSFMWITSIPLAIGIFCISSTFVPWFFGEGYEEVCNILRILTWMIIIIGISNITGTQYLIPTKQQNVYTKSVILGMLVNIILNLVFIPKFYARGAAMARLMTDITVSGLQLYYVKNFFSLRKICTLSYKYWIAGIIMGICVCVEKQFFSISTFSMFVLIASAAILYAGILLILRDEFMIQILSEAMSRLKTLFGGKK